MCARARASAAAHTITPLSPQARSAARKYARIIQKLDFPAKFTDFKIQNMVGSCDVKFPVRLEGLAYKHSHYSSVRPLPPPARHCTHAARAHQPGE